MRVRSAQEAFAAPIDARVAETPIAEPSIPAPVALQPKVPGTAVDELALVAKMQAALRVGDSAAALLLAAEHEQRFPRGLLVEEREGARVLARCVDGERSANAAGGRAFLQDHPRSPLRARIVEVCGD